MKEEWIIQIARWEPDPSVPRVEEWCFRNRLPSAPRFGRLCAEAIADLFARELPLTDDVCILNVRTEERKIFNRGTCTFERC